MSVFRGSVQLCKGLFYLEPLNGFEPLTPSLPWMGVGHGNPFINGNLGISSLKTDFKTDERNNMLRY